MDITIPPHNLKRFAASLTCLGKIGKDLYLSFDPLDGLTLSSLNEAKSAYGRFHFDPGFFERCSAPALATVVGATSARGRRSGGSGRRIGAEDRDEEGDDSDDDGDGECYDTRYVCRVPVRSVHSILRPRRGVCSLRIRSEGMDDGGNYFGLSRKKGPRDQRGGGRKRRNGDRHHRSGEEDDEDDENDEEGGRRRGGRRGSFSARERRSRKRRKQTKLGRRNNRGNDDEDDTNTNQSNSISRNTDKMMLSFEYFIERPAPKINSNDNDNHNNPNNNSGAQLPNGGVFRVLHKVGVTDANGITLSASVTQRRTRSEIVSHPRTWLRLLDPLRRTAEVALTIDDELRVVTATSFHPGEVQQLAAGGENAVLQAAAARNAVLKTETSTGADEFDEYDFRNNRGKKRKRKRKDERRRRKEDGSGSEDDSSSSENGEEEENDEYDFEKESDRPPLDVNQKVILVFGIKEAKVWTLYSFFCCPTLFLS